MRTFTAYRPNVPTDTHNEDQRNEPHMPQFQGVIFDTGRCAIQWLTAIKSVSVFESFEEMMRIHGHPEYGTYVVFA